MPLVLVGLQRRLVFAAVAWLCASVVVASAVFGVVFALAAAESDLRDVLDGAPLRTAVRFQMVGADGSGQLTPTEAASALRSSAWKVRNQYFAAPVASLYVNSQAVGAELDRQPFKRPMVPLAYRSGACAHLQVLRGRCPTGPDEAIVSTRSVASPYGYRLGQLLAVGEDALGDKVDVRVVGVYAPRDSQEPYWGGPQYFNNGVAGESVTLDAVFVDRTLFARLGPATVVRASFDRSVATERVRIRDLSALDRAVNGFRREDRAGGTAYDVDTALGTVLAQAARQRSAIYASSALIVLQLCVLGWVTLFRVLQEFIGSRDAEVVLAKLRGYRLLALLRFSSVESLMVLLLAAPTGIGSGWWAAERLALAVLRPGTPVVVPPVGLLVTGAAIGGGLIAVAVSATLLLRRTIGEQSRRTHQGATPSRLLAIVEGLLVLAAASASVALRVAGTRYGVVGLLAPGLLIVAVAAILGRALPVLLAPAVRRTRNRRRLELLLAVRQVVRRPAGARLVSLLTVAVGLAVFGISGEAIAAQNRVARAAVEMGATAVQRITVTVGEDPIAAVRRADPDGTWAAGAAQWLSFGGNDLQGTLLAVDSARLPAVVPRVPGIQDPAALARAVQGAVAPVTLRGRRVELSVAASGAQGTAPTLLLELQRADGSDAQVDLGEVDTGPHMYKATVPCTAGCTLAGISVNAPAKGDDASGALIIQRLTVNGRTVDAGLRMPAAWRVHPPLGDATVHGRADRNGLEISYRLGLGGTVGLAHNGIPNPVPAVVTPAGVARPSVGARLTITSSDSSTAQLRVTGTSSVLPAVVGGGVLVDAAAFQAALPTFVPDATWAVWLGPHAPPDARQRLARAGLVLDGTPETLAARQGVLAREGPALALLLLQVMGIAGVLCAVGGVVVSIRAVLRRRSYEGAALLTIGVTRAQLLRAILLEQTLLLGSAVLFGVPAGLLAVVLAMPALQQANTPSAVPQAVLPPAGPVVGLTVVLVTLVLVAIALSGFRVVRAARAGRLREGEE